MIDMKPKKSKKPAGNPMASSHTNFFLKEHLGKHRKNQMSDDKTKRKANNSKTLSISFEDSENKHEAQRNGHRIKFVSVERKFERRDKDTLSLKEIKRVVPRKK